MNKSNKLPNPPKVVILAEDIFHDIYEDSVADYDISMEKSGLFDVE